MLKTVLYGDLAAKTGKVNTLRTKQSLRNDTLLNACQCKVDLQMEVVATAFIHFYIFLDMADNETK